MSFMARTPREKSNLLEALWLFTGGRSFRGAKDAELVRLGQQRALASLCFYSGEREQEAEISVQNGRRAAKLNGVEKNPLPGSSAAFAPYCFARSICAW